MFRFVSFLGVVALTVAAAALAKQSQRTSRQALLEHDTQDDVCEPAAVAAEAAFPAFHARFSLN